MDTNEQAAPEGELTLTLDRDAEFAAIHGDHAGAYEQNGFIFDAQGNVMMDFVTAPDRKRLERFAKMRRAKAEAEAAYREAMGEDAPAELAVKFIDKNAGDKPFDYRAYVSGRLKIPFYKVQAQVVADFNEKPTDRENAIAILRENNAV